MDSKQQLNQALFTSLLSGLLPTPRAGLPVGENVPRQTPLVSMAYFGDVYGVTANICNNPYRSVIPYSEAITFGSSVIDFGNIADTHQPRRRITLPLIRSKRPGAVNLTNAQIEELLD
jgi:hypothetical protein